MYALSCPSCGSDEPTSSQASQFKTLTLLLVLVVTRYGEVLTVHEAMIGRSETRIRPHQSPSRGR